MGNRLKVEYVHQHDLPQIVNLHIKLFNGYFLTNLRYNLLFKYYKEYFQDSDSTFLKAQVGNDIVGFVLSTSKYEQILSQFYRKNFWGLSFRLIFEILKLNKIIILGLKERIPKLFELIRRKIPKKLPHQDLNEQQYTDLLSIAVDSHYRGKDVALLLISSLENKLKEKSHKSYRLSVKSDNKRAIGFYLKVGFNKYYNDSELEYYKKEII